METLESENDFAAVVCKDLSFQVIAAAFEVHNTLGPGFLETVYEKALLRELHLRGLIAEAQKEIRIKYKGEDVGAYFPDILVENQIILELKAVEQLVKFHEAQLLHYLKATGLKVGILINFSGERVTYKRMVTTRSR